MGRRDMEGLTEAPPSRRVVSTPVCAGNGMTSFGFHTSHFSPMFGGHGASLDVIAAAGRAGFGAIGLDVGTIAADRAHGVTVEQMRAALKEADLVCSDLVGFIGPCADAVATSRELADSAEQLAAPLCVASVGTEAPFGELVTMLDTVAGTLDESGVRLGIEFIPGSGIPTLAAAVRLCAELGWERSGVVLDTFHHFVARTPLSEVAALRAADIALVQCCDALTETPLVRADESRHRRRLPGTGVLALSEWVSAIRSTGYTGVVASEVLSAELRERPVDEVAHECLAALTRTWWGVAP